MSPKLVLLSTGLGYAGILFLFAGQSAAQCTPGCPAQGNAVLTVPAQALPGSGLTMSLQGASNNLPALIGISTGEGPLCLPWGKICLSAPIVAINGSTPLTLDTVLPSTTPAKTTIHLQGFVLDNAAPNGFVALSRSHSLTTLPGLTVYSDAGLFDALGTYAGGGGSINLAEIKNSPSAPEGENYQQATFGLPPAGGWAGLFLQAGPLNSATTVDLSAIQTTGFLRFMIRSTNELEVGIRSQNIGPGQERSKLLLRQSNYAKLDGTWESVAIPLSAFTALESRLDFSQMKILFGLAVTNGFVTVPSGTFDFDFVRWSN